MEPIWNGNEQREEKKTHLKPIHGIALFLVVMLCFYTIIAWAQWTFGMYGLALTEIFLLVLSLGSAKLLKAPVREIFPVRKPEWKKLLAVLAGWVSAYAAVIPLTMTAAYFFPSQIFRGQRFSQQLYGQRASFGICPDQQCDAGHLRGGAAPGISAEVFPVQDTQHGWAGAADGCSVRRLSWKCLEISSHSLSGRCADVADDPYGKSDLSGSVSFY